MERLKKDIFAKSLQLETRMRLITLLLHGKVRNPEEVRQIIRGEIERKNGFREMHSRL